VTRTSETLEQALRRRAREEIAGDRDLSREYVQARRARRIPIWQLLRLVISLLGGGAMMLVAIPLMLIALLHQHKGTDLVLAAQSVLTAGVAFTLAFGVTTSLRRSQIVSVLSHLPASDAECVRRVWQSLAALSAALIYPNLLITGFLGLEDGWDAAGWMVGLAAAVAHWGVCVALGAILAVCLPAWLTAGGAGLCAIATVAYFYFDAPNAPEVVRAVFVAFPTGWVNAVLRWGQLQGNPEACWAVVPVMMCLAAGVAAYVRLRNSHRVKEFAIQSGGHVEAVVAGDASSIESSRPWLRAGLFSGHIKPLSEESVPLSLDEAVKRIRSREFLAPSDWSRRGWIERRVERRLTPRERLLAEFLTGDDIRWTRQWRAILLIVPICLTYFMLNQNQIFVGIMMTQITLFGGLAAMGADSWPAFRSRNCVGSFVTHHAAFPVGFDEVRRCLAKIDLVRGLTYFPLCLAGGLLLTRDAPLWPLEGFLVAAGINGLLLTGSVWRSDALFWASGLPATSRWWRALSWWLTSILLRLAAIVGAILLLVSFVRGGAKGVWVGSVGAALVIGCTTAIWLLTRAAFRGGRVDFVRTRQSELDKMLERTEQAHQQSRRKADLRRRYGWFWFLRKGPDPVQADRVLSD